MVFGTEIAGRVQRAALGLLDELAGSRGMAGSDASGSAWAAAYDAAAATTVAVAQDVINGCYRLGSLLQQTSFNYSRAESWSTPGSMVLLPDSDAYASCSVRLGAPPSAAGGDGSTPWGWWLIEHAVACAWPGGDQGRLRTAGAAWSVVACAVGEATLNVPTALECIASQVSPEVDDAMTACRAMDQHLWDLAEVCRSLSRACSDFAGYLDKAHSAIERELVSLLEWTAVIEAAGGLFAVVTFGASEAAAQGAEAGRIAAAAARVSAIIQGVVELAGAAAQFLAGAADRAIEISYRLKGLLGTRLSITTGKAVENLPELSRTAELVADERLAAAAQSARVPALSMSRTQLEKKFKHASDFGVVEPKGARGYKEFSDAVDGFMKDSDTTRVVGTYRKQPAVLSYNPVTRLVVAQSPDGAFICGWKMSEEQLHNVVERRSLGGG